jgi:predicted phage-related endonuclease
MGITYHRDLVQGSDEWLQARCGLLTASEMKLIVTPTLKPARNDKERAHLFELLAQRLTGYVEPHYISDDMLRGQEDELMARSLYAEKYAPVEELGFITNDKWGFTLGYSPDGLVGTDGLIECKSRRQKYQVRTICENLIPEEYWLQIQTGFLVSERQWLDFVTYSGGLPMMTLRAYPDQTVMDAILEAASDFERRLAEAKTTYLLNLNPPSRTLPTERRVEQEMYI